MQAGGAPSGAPGLRARRSSTAGLPQAQAAAAPPAPPPPVAPPRSEMPAAPLHEADALVRGRYQEYMATRIALSNQARRVSSSYPIAAFFSR
jgi:hypothetical protein